MVVPRLDDLDVDVAINNLAIFTHLYRCNMGKTMNRLALLAPERTPRDAVR